MARQRDIRRCALQVLYQLDAGGEADETVRASLAGSPGDESIHDAGFALARRVWTVHADADAAVAARPAVAHAPPAGGGSLPPSAGVLRDDLRRHTPEVAINEAVELAKEFSTERSPMFINGVLDKLFRQLPETSCGAPEI